MFKHNGVRNIFSLAIAGIVASAIASSIIKNRNNIAQAQEKPKVVASHNVICDLVTTIAEDTLDLTCLIDDNQDPHTYSPTPSQRKAIEEAQLIFYGGYQLEPKVINLLEATDNKIPRIALYEQVVTEPLVSEHEHEEHSEAEAGHDHEQESESESAKSEPELEADPHVWHNIENTVAMVEAIESTLLQVNPQAAELYLVNSTALTDQLWQLDAWIDEQIATIPAGQRVLFTTHDSLNYYAQAYYLEDYRTLQGLSSSVSPTASQVRKLSAEIKQAGVPTIFTESTQNDRVINNVARIANVELSPEKLYVDGLGQAENYTEMMSHNTCAIVNGLGGKCKPFAAKN
ncbi:MAG TPA: zinc ABC transporter substrate-binding protein [Coleofasciculaceae cyanobacterium]|jgi:ABC-type Zn uptake system ZnuABC Zn-binding protein ZnuA